VKNSINWFLYNSYHNHDSRTPGFLLVMPKGQNSVVAMQQPLLQGSILVQ